MMILISAETPVAQEHRWLNEMFACGLELFHIRKYRLSDDELKRYVERIDQRYLARLVLHDRHYLAEELGIARLHFPEIARERAVDLSYRDDYMLSTSVHSIQDFNELNNQWSYAFLSPVFPSISKENYGGSSQVLNTMVLRRNAALPLVGLGGITEYNCEKVYSKGADGIALLGSVWQSKEPLNRFINVKRKADRIERSRL